MAEKAKQKGPLVCSHGRVSAGYGVLTACVGFRRDQEVGEEVNGSPNTRRIWEGEEEEECASGMNYDFLKQSE